MLYNVLFYNRFVVKCIDKEQDTFLVYINYSPKTKLI